jgi:hypothetical protein
MKEYQALVREYEARLVGHERSYAQALERIELCVALNDAKGDELKAAVAKRL